ncbi:hypothetical protein DFJ43DRAFT_1037215 [Lentinula guzmanii]|uniref:BTB domain-containing protein n=2 Tax=Lentinula TaxID=5352 RepID=A0AA38JRN7_9AGAR|nr:hypothetical protein DFJ43DRAFT_1037215 [Lentinula guzmanii]KAJ3992209.1 hypothetical protein F5050DRAFT_1811718 [Lentinula boryana]
MVFRTGNVAMDIDGLYPSFSDRYCYMGFTQVLRVEQGDILVRSMDSYIFALDSDLVLGAAGCIPFNHEYSLIPGISDLRYDSATLSWIFTFLRREEVKPIEDLSFTQLIGIARAASEFGFHSIQTLCRLALRRFRNRNSQDILSLSVQYGYHALLPMLAATKLIDTPLTSLQDILRDPSIYRAWSLFRDQRIAALEVVREQHSKVHTDANCLTWATEAAVTYLRLGRPSTMDPSRICEAFGSTGALPACCSSAIEQWRKYALDISQGLPTFSL